QIGNGRSTHMRGAGPEVWTVDLFLSELDNLLGHLGIQDRYAVLGQSWGGMLAAEHAVRRPRGLQSLVIADSPASMITWVAEANRLREALPPEVQATLLKHEAAGTTDDPEYTRAVEVFNARHVCRVVPNPPEVQRTFDAIAEDPTVYHTMNGPSEFHVIGTLKTGPSRTASTGSMCRHSSSLAATTRRPRPACGLTRTASPTCGGPFSKSRATSRTWRRRTPAWPASPLSWTRPTESAQQP
ncbi:MAG TPA: alpha/beta fold hydrolase, partial [Rubellimicrobium sp.]|nr:alpha/beta fold hydrolase [Rubellimicrobium sp.]